MPLLQVMRTGTLQILRRYCSTEKSVIETGIYQDVFQHMPGRVQMAFAYGSGVFQQTDGIASQNMLDFIIVVDDPQQWHRENMSINYKHYSFLKHFGSVNVAKIQSDYGAGIYFNTLVPFKQRLIKYGVIGTSKLISDLRHWDSLYVSGRLHKPVKMVKKASSAELILAMHTNLRSAVHASLLLLPETFTEMDLYTTITGLSYSGDFRMKFGEDKGKVSKIVTPNLQHFKYLYQPILPEIKHLSFNEKLNMFVHFQNESTRFYHLNLLPRGVTQNMLLLKHKEEPFIYPDSEEFIRKMAQDGTCPEYIGKSVAGIVKKSSWSQSVKGILTAGIRKSIRYSYSKVKKMFKGMRNKS